jgi:hypothetical protein
VPRAAQIPGDRPRRLARQPASRRLATQSDLSLVHPYLLRSINMSAAASIERRMETICLRRNRQPGKRCTRGQQ